MYKVFDHGDSQKLEIAESLQYKGYIKIETHDPKYSLTRKGVDYCNNLKNQL